MFKWTRVYAAFVPEIDAEHRALFRLGDELQQAIEASADAERLNSIVQSIVTGLEDHFAHEERLMRSSHYPIYAWHKQQHDGARRRIKRLAASMSEGEGNAPLELAEYLAGWLKDHVGLTDRMFGAYLRNYDRLQAVAS
jgi:hemerythrin